MECKIGVLRGDGVGRIISAVALGCLDAVGQRFGHKFTFSLPLFGGDAITKTGVPLPQETIDECLTCGGILCGTVGGDAFDGMAAHLRPEKALLSLCSSLGLYANIRPVLLYDGLKLDSPLKPTLTKKGINLLLVRAQTGGIYYGQRGYREGKNGQEAYDTEVYSIAEVERLANLAFTLAMGRNKRLTSVDKSDVLETGRLWRATVSRIAKRYPEVKVQHLLVDNCAAQLISNPSKFDVILCPSMFGDFLSHIAGTLTGSAALVPSCYLGDTTLGLYTPVRSVSSDTAGADVANPIGAILAAAMMLSSSFGLTEETTAMEKAINAVLAKGYRTADLSASSAKVVSCSKMGELIAEEILHG